MDMWDSVLAYLADVIWQWTSLIAAIAFIMAEGLVLSRRWVKSSEPPRWLARVIESPTWKWLFGIGLVVFIIANFNAYHNMRRNLASLSPDIWIKPGHVYHLDDGSELQGYFNIGNNSKNSWKIITVGANIILSPKTEFSLLKDVGPLKVDGGPVLKAEDEQGFFRNFGRTLSDSEIDAVKSGVVHIILFGRISYNDSLNQRQDSEFCHIYSGAETSNLFNGYRSIQAQNCRLGH